ncbi:MAG: response regulator, partial [Anaerolineales bacterium]|nr:response regulator [Anaerolineales bacterium]
MQSPPANILIVDDTPANLRLLANILSKAGYVVRPARSGRIALSSAQSEPPDLILLDIMMPDMDGYEVCRHLKINETTRNIPVIFISALNDVEEKVKSFEIGGVDYIPKPFHGDEVLARVNTHLTIRSLQKDLMAQIAELDAFAHTVAH